MDPITILAGLIPLAVDLGKSAINRWITPDTFKPGTVAEWLQMRASDVELFKAMNDIGGTAVSYPWVEAIIKLQRPLVVAVTLATWSYMQLFGTGSTDAVNNFAAAVGFYLFGDRTLFYTKKAGAKG